jgi:PAS domain S-box-containing protein
VPPFWLYPKPTGDPGRDRNAQTLQFACLLLALGIAVVVSVNVISREWERLPIYGLELAVLGAAFVINRSGRWKLAAWTVTAAVLLEATLLVWQARDGFRSNAMLLFPELLLISILLLDRRSYWITASVILLTVAGLGIAERQGLTAAIPGVRTHTGYGSIFFVEVPMLVFAFIGNRIVRDTQSNVSELRSIIATLRESELRYREVFEHFSECILVLEVTPDRRFRFAALNPAEERATGLFSAEVAGKFIEDVLTEETAKRAIAHYRHCLEVGTVIHYDEELDLPIGARYFHTNLIPLRNEAGQIHRIVGCSLDFTDLKRGQEEAFARQKLESIGTLASGIAHDFNNLLGAALAQADLAIAQHGSGASPAEALHAIQGLAIRGSEIVQQLMVYAGKDGEVPELVDVSSVVRETHELLKVLVSKHAILAADLGERLPPVRCSAAQLRQIVLNLVTNASEAIGDQDGVIRLATRKMTVVRAAEASAEQVARSTLVTGENLKDSPEGECVELVVADNGKGMSPETLARVFDPFFTTKSPGRGLGLGVVQGIVRNLGGGIRIASEAGKGTTVRVWLPCAEAMAGEAIEPVARGGPVRLSRKLTVLVVEDEAPLRQAVATILSREGFEVLEASNGSAAIELIRANGEQIDLVLLDVTIPGASSQEVVVEAAKARPDIKLILTSAYSLEMVTDRINPPIVHDFIRKPFRLLDLVRVLHKAALSEDHP